MKVLRILFVFAALVGVGIAVVRLRTETRQTGYLISRMWTEQQTLKRTCLELELELARLRDPHRLESESARLNLDLGPPGVVGWWHLPAPLPDD